MAKEAFAEQRPRDYKIVRAQRVTSIIHYSLLFIICNAKALPYGDVKVSTGTAKLGKRVAARRRYKSLNYKLNNKNTVALAA